MAEASKTSVLFVCLGNICRSPTGEGVFQHWVKQHGLEDQIAIDSAGTIGYHAGNPADSRMRSHAKKRGYALQSISRKVTHKDFERFDLIVAMDRSNHADLLGMGCPEDKLILFGECLGEPFASAPEVPDPYYGGEAGFETVLDMIEAGCQGLQDRLLAIHAKDGSA